ncbi:MAG: Zn-ribbon domain-containing OB-fold protein [Dehalococcoidia bacterium]|nr:Zn-ribbon domain-containing OB-fold protein [Dehalococcoidia bacterium]
MTTSTQQWTRPMPTPTPLTEPFWKATAEGRLVIQRCNNCGEYVWTPQMACRSCLTETLEWTPVSGRGTIDTFVIIHRAATPAFTAPYAIVVVELEEGPRILSDMVEVAVTDVHIGMPVEVQFELAGDIGFYHFRPRR